MEIPIDIKTKQPTGQPPTTTIPGTKSRNLVALQRQTIALQRRLEGKSYRDIAKELGVSDVAVIKMVRKALSRDMTLTAEKAEEVRQIECHRLDMLITAHMEWALKGDEKSAAVVLRCMDRRAAYLGLDAPKKVTVEEKSDIDQQIERLMERLKSSRQVPTTVEIDCEAQPVDAGRPVERLAANGGSGIREDAYRRGGQRQLCAPEPGQSNSSGGGNLP